MFLDRFWIETCILTLNSLIKFTRLHSALAENELMRILQCLVDILNNRPPEGGFNKLKLNWSWCLLEQSHIDICQDRFNVVAIFVHNIL